MDVSTHNASHHAITATQSNIAGDWRQLVWSIAVNVFDLSANYIVHSVVAMTQNLLAISTHVIINTLYYCINDKGYNIYSQVLRYFYRCFCVYSYNTNQAIVNSMNMNSDVIMLML